MNEPKSYSEITSEQEAKDAAGEMKFESDREEIKKWVVCPECDGEKSELSDCCGATMDTDQMLCYECHDHCEAWVCEVCDGEGRVEAA